MSVLLSLRTSFDRELLCFAEKRTVIQGILAEVLDFVMGKGLIPADGEIWRVRRRAIVPALHKKVIYEIYPYVVSLGRFLMHLRGRYLHSNVVYIVNLLLRYSLHE